MPENVLPDEFVKSGLEILGGIYLEVMETRNLKQGRNSGTKESKWQAAG